MRDFKMDDGVHGMVTKSKMSPGAAKLRSFYEMKADAPVYQTEFGFYSKDRWMREGYITEDTDLHKLFRFDEPGGCSLHGLGWCEAAFSPAFEEMQIEDRGEYELVQDFAGRHVLFFKGRRSGFMPEYLIHPVKDMQSWEDNCKWRLDPGNARRTEDLKAGVDAAKECAAKGMVITQRLVGGFMYLRSLIGPLDLLYKFHDDPDLIHACMRTWLDLADSVTAFHQQSVTFDELFIAEDICYNHGSLISPGMMREFLFPYYEQLLANIKSRQIDKARHLYFQVDTDGQADPVIPLYKEIGMDYMSPFEVASGCDVVAIGKRYPGLLMLGGFDKRILAQGKEAIDREIGRILPVMKQRGGYIPTCDHGVPEEVSFGNYMHYRNRMLEYAH
ncbi:MAG: uroporphyrinogen decarboxylase family protein [Saccharofermentanales bacterium]